MKSLKEILQRIDGKGYKAYKDLKGKYVFPDYVLYLDYIQGDPFASPSKLRVMIPRRKTKIADIYTNTKARRIASEDLLTRKIARNLSGQSYNIYGTGKSGLIAIDRPGQEILERTATTITESDIIICLSVGLPAQGRRILGKQAEKIFTAILPSIIRDTAYSLLDEELDVAAKLSDQQQAIRTFIQKNNFISFIGNGSILPRESGISDYPLANAQAVPFKSPASMEVEIKLPHQNEPIKGMAIKEGITLIVGGGYHGKSTLLKAIERGVYDHIKGDGREFVITNPSSFKIRAEDGRKVTNVDISPFIKNLPYGIDTNTFSTENASGSTSQAANIIEALEAGAETLLIDEDTSATNFMIRDRRMQALVVKENEPITPFIDKVKQLYDNYGVSTILVMGGSGDYFDVCDQVIMLEQYEPYDVTAKAKQIAEQISYSREQEGGNQFGQVKSRVIEHRSLHCKVGKKSKVKTRGIHTIQYGKTDISLHNVEQLVDDSQTRMIGEILQFLERRQMLRRKLTIKEILKYIEREIEEKGLSSVTAFGDQHPGELAKPRMLEVAATLNRMRSLIVS